MLCVTRPTFPEQVLVIWVEGSLLPVLVFLVLENLGQYWLVPADKIFTVGPLINSGGVWGAAT